MAKENAPPPGQAIAEQFAAWACALDGASLPSELREIATSALIDHAGLSVSARHEEYVQAIVSAWEGKGGCTAFGHAQGFDAAGAALVNGTASHGEDYDDTFEGTPVHTSAVIVPAVLAACERYGRSGEDALRGIAVGAELMCRMAIVAPTAQHRAGFHPTAIIGALGAAAGVGTALRLTPTQMVDSLGVAASFASGIIEYLAEGTWTKRIHPGWAAQAGLRAALFGRAGFKGPRTVFEGEHGFFYAFGVPEIAADFSRITSGLGDEWKAARIAFKPYACGTMVQPFIDCAIRLAREGVGADQIEDVLCKVGEGTVHRLWEPLAEKRRPSTPYSAKFSVPFGVAVGFVNRAAGLGQFTDERITDPDVLELAGKVHYEIDPNDEYPRNYTGTVIVTLKDGSTRSAHQPHMRGGAREPLSRAEILDKFRANTRYGGWTDHQAEALAQWCERLFGAPNLDGIEEFRA
ncbi:MmgE/PrpD family protein [Microvirga makkahensis]|uniref:MmgE/PrpD family protein n=1 Tax=Microvirga makkahensis TaxID=1128670 RepID=A0A7X3SRA2_9HYPH|nr:MmgE/PrpD family protein [Microvirga makkahensis]MXQ14357.1 MmgE/PrpD family protein [Microvirga makkahensis]